MDISRREALRVGGSVATTTLAGCSVSALSGPQQLQIGFSNDDTVSHELVLELILATDPDRGSTVLRRRFALPPSAPPTGGDVTRTVDVAENREYLIRAFIEDTHRNLNVDDSSRRHFHYFPSRAKNSEPDLVIEITEDLILHMPVP